MRLSYKKMDSYIGKLKSIFHANGRDGEKDRLFRLGNPAADKLVKDFLRLVTAEKLQSRVNPKQATPFFLDKLTCLVEHLQRPLENAKSNIERFIVASDQVYFKTVFFSGFRSGCANTLALTGADLSEIMEHTGWVRCHTALYYQQLAKVLNQSGASARLAETSVNEVATPWKDTNELEQFVCAFPGATSRKRSHPVELVTLPRGRAAENYRNV